MDDYVQANKHLSFHQEDPAEAVDSLLSPTVAGQIEDGGAARLQQPPHLAQEGGRRDLAGHLSGAKEVDANVIEANLAVGDVVESVVHDDAQLRFLTQGEALARHRQDFDVVVYAGDGQRPEASPQKVHDRAARQAEDQRRAGFGIRQEGGPVASADVGAVDGDRLDHALHHQGLLAIGLDHLDAGTRAPIGHLRGVAEQSGHRLVASAALPTDVELGRTGHGHYGHHPRLQRVAHH